MTIQPTDIALVVISLVACFYCVLLGRKLKALQNTKDGLGATISAFTKATSEISAATQLSCQQASQQATKLFSLITEANETCTKLTALAQETEARLGKVATESEVTSKAIEAHLDEILKDAKAQNDELTALSEQMRVLSSQTTDAIRDAISQSVTSSKVIPAPPSALNGKQAEPHDTPN